MKLEGLYPDSTNSIGFSANVYEKICGALVGYWKKGRGASNTVVRYLRLFFYFLLRVTRARRENWKIAIFMDGMER